jgi:hypothetical protein
MGRKTSVVNAEKKLGIACQGQGALHWAQALVTHSATLDPQRGGWLGLVGEITTMFHQEWLCLAWH